MKKKFNLFLTTLLFAQLACTSSPVGDNEISPGKRQLSGEVILSDDGDPEGVYVWLSGFDIGARTDRKGHFELILPPPSQQASSGGVSGAFQLYFYVANYNLDSTTVAIDKGEFVFGQGEVNSQGQLSAPKFLTRALKISTSVIPPSLSTQDLDLGVPRPVFVSVKLEAGTRPVTVDFPLQSGDVLGPIIFRNIDTDSTVIFGSTINGIPGTARLTLQDAEFIRLMTVPMSPNIMPFGKYEIIPYLFVEQKLPRGLLQSLGEDVESLSPAYLNIPFKRQSAIFSFDP